MADNNQNNNKKKDIPQYAFNPYTFGMSAATSAIASISKASLESSQLKMDAEAFDTNARMALANFAINNIYDNMMLENNVQNIVKSHNKLSAAQVAFHAASGFQDVSTGDKRLLADTARSKEAALYDANMQAYYTAFEKNRQANIQYIQNTTQAKIARQQAKYASGWGMFSNILTGALNAFAGSISPAKGEISSAGV